MSNLLSVKGLSVNNIFSNISFNIAEKSFNILVGKNSIGKTCLVCSILGLTKYKGEIEFKYDRKDIGCISDYTYITENSVFEYLSKPLINLGNTESKTEKTVYSVAKRLGIDNLLNKTREQLNIEETLMVMLMHAVVHNPKLVIIDNTLDELHESNRIKFIKYLKSMKTTVIFVTNDSRYFRYSNRILVMTKSKMETIKDSMSITRLENLLVKNNSELPFNLELSSKLYSYGLIKELYNDSSELVENIWK